MAARSTGTSRSVTFVTTTGTAPKSPRPRPPRPLPPGDAAEPEQPAPAIVMTSKRRPVASVRAFGQSSELHEAFIRTGLEYARGEGSIYSTGCIPKAPVYQLLEALPWPE